jgi:hypothetical protein
MCRPDEFGPMGFIKAPQFHARIPSPIMTQLGYRLAPHFALLVEHTEQLAIMRAASSSPRVAASSCHKRFHGSPSPVSDSSVP